MFIATTKGGLVIAGQMDIVPFLTGFYSEQRIDKSSLKSLLNFRVILKTNCCYFKICLIDVKHVLDLYPVDLPSDMSPK
jgi:hypothetical protein